MIGLLALVHVSQGGVVGDVVRGLAADYFCLTVLNIQKIQSWNEII